MRVLPCLLCALTLQLATASAEASMTRDVTYSYKAVWTTAIRLLRADRGYEITDRDKEAGYILFIYPGSGSVKRCQGTLEIVPTKDTSGAHVVRLQMRIAHQPSYIALDLLDRLERKLRDERGAPPKARRDPPPPKDKAPAPPDDDKHPKGKQPSSR